MARAEQLLSEYLAALTTDLNMGGKIYFDVVNGQFGIGRTPTEDLDIYKATGIITSLIETGGNNSVTHTLKNSLREWDIQNAGANGNLSIIDVDGSRTIMEYDTDGVVNFGGAIAFSSSGRLTITTGSYDDLDVTDTGTLIANTVSGTITLNGFDGGISEQPLFIRRATTANDLIFMHNDAGGTQKIFNTSAADVTIALSYYHVIGCSGSAWYTGLS